MGIIHEIFEAFVSDITFSNVIATKEKGRIESEVIDVMCNLLSGWPRAKEMEYERKSSLRTKSDNNFDKIEMKHQAQEYKKQQGKDLEEFFKSFIDSYAVSHIHMIFHSKV
ncbi:uncharacterized protein LOC109821933 [Asparagus officinalis]|uniref:uncharacterized protein LOC109821933 n=1 Tax=Asparagus officinalis TaxID=4686 RepID=UPI00098E671C|nr:uncharacterized protein LOC109821933 [Asparagus officinalis]